MRERPSNEASDLNAWVIPESVRDRFTQQGTKLYFPDGRLAIRDFGRRLTTPTEDDLVVRSLVEIAKARGLEEVTVGGSDAFRQKAWREATLAGLEVRGYRASAEERASMIRRLSSREHEREPTSQSAPEETTRPPSDAPKAKGADERIAGKLLDHGREHYRFDPKRDVSYYVRLQTPEGKKVIWGADFERALRNSLSQPKLGDEVVLQRRGREAVKVTRHEFDPSGEILSETPLETHRNAWSVETRSFLEARGEAAEALRKRPSLELRRTHPELAGALLQVRAAELAARGMANAQDRERFVSMVREALAERVARGEALPPVQLREPAARASRAEREAPTR